MAWNQSAPNSENLNKGTEKEKKPKSVKFAYFCCGLLSAQGLFLGTGSYLFPTFGYNPWTVGVGFFTWCVELWRNDFQTKHDCGSVCAFRSVCRRVGAL